MTAKRVDNRCRIRDLMMFYSRQLIGSSKLSKLTQQRYWEYPSMDVPGSSVRNPTTTTWSGSITDLQLRQSLHLTFRGCSMKHISISYIDCRKNMTKMEAATSGSFVILTAARQTLEARVFHQPEALCSLLVAAAVPWLQVKKVSRESSRRRSHRWTRLQVLVE